MNFAELKELVVQLTNRPEILEKVTPETQPRVVTALKAAHTSLQNDELVDRSYGVPVRIPCEWQCQVWEDDGLTYKANGPGLPIVQLLEDATRTLKRITDVKYLSNRPGEPSEYIPIDPATQEEIEWYRLSEHDNFHTRRLHKHVFHQRWFTDSGFLQLLFPEGHEGSDLTLSVRLLQTLPFYVNNADFDYFSTACWQALGFGAAYWAMIFIGEPDDAKEFKAVFEEQAIKAIRADKHNAQGGQDTNYRPPLATGRRY